MFDRNMLIAKLNELVHNLKATKARSYFIQHHARLSLNIYKYEPSDYLELVEENESQTFPAEFEVYKDFKEREAQRHEYEQWMAQERKQKTSRHMAGNLALTFLFKD